MPAVNFKAHNKNIAWEEKDLLLGNNTKNAVNKIAGFQPRHFVSSL